MSIFECLRMSARDFDWETKGQQYENNLGTTG